MNSKEQRIYEKVLKLIKEGKTYSQIISRFPKLTDQQYKLAIRKSNIPSVCFGSKQEAYYKDENFRVDNLVYSIKDLKGKELEILNNL